MSTQRRCPVLIEGVGCGRNATVLDHKRTGESWPPVYICQECYQREYRLGPFNAPKAISMFDALPSPKRTAQ